MEPQPIDPYTSFSVDMTLEEVNKVIAVLGTQPFREVAGLINSLANQVEAQVQALHSEDLAKTPIPPEGEGLTGGESIQ